MTGFSSALSVHPHCWRGTNPNFILRKHWSYSCNYPVWCTGSDTKHNEACSAWAIKIQGWKKKKLLVSSTLQSNSHNSIKDTHLVFNESSSMCAGAVFHHRPLRELAGGNMNYKRRLGSDILFYPWAPCEQIKVKKLKWTLLCVCSLPQRPGRFSCWVFNSTVAAWYAQVSLRRVAASQ